jgi:uroporphyrinogen-III synthase
MRDALHGRTIVVTRPAGQSAGLVKAIAAAGGESLCFPLLEIEPADPAAVVETASPHLAGATLAIFVSPNAVRHGLLPIRTAGLWPPGLAVGAVGQGSARALAAAGVAHVLAPEAGFDSEALLALEPLQAPRVADRDVMLFKGEGGRPLLADTLSIRGARVHPVDCYRRLAPVQSPDALIALAGAGRLDAVVITSSEALAHFDRLLGAHVGPAVREWLIVATHPRIGEAATRLGYRRVLVTEPGDTVVAAALTAYNWPSSAMHKK